MAKASVRLEGTEELNTQLERLAAALGADAVEEICEGGAAIVANAIRSRAPRGPTGNLQRSVVSKRLRRRGTDPAPAIAAIDYLIGPHAHLVEYGTVHMQARPFFRPGVDATKDAALKHLADEVSRLIDGAVT